MARKTKAVKQEFHNHQENHKKSASYQQITAKSALTIHLFPSEQLKVVCNQHLHAECSRSATISLEVTTEIYQI